MTEENPIYLGSRKNPLIVKGSLGKSKPTTYDLPDS